MECPEFRELLLYLGDGKIDDTELPHRTKITQMILDEYRKEYNKAKDDLKACSFPYYFHLVNYFTTEIECSGTYLNDHRPME